MEIHKLIRKEPRARSQMAGRSWSNQRKSELSQSAEVACAITPCHAAERQIACLPPHHLCWERLIKGIAEKEASHRARCISVSIVGTTRTRQTMHACSTNGCACRVGKLHANAHQRRLPECLWRRGIGMSACAVGMMSLASCCHLGCHLRYAHQLTAKPLDCHELAGVTEWLRGRCASCGGGDGGCCSSGSNS